ncbi:pyridoxamine 5'-phosphate oxidase family protein [Actinomadura rubrisoli]|uniref:Pyridoxamine 5'-phosphate oxidase family protein n=1 Tax=Actinomadura rubrisoli TaxID=2530368 RepID=A0A4R5BZ13_9ACTN|nr:pyridoxamine 5'-phosphate oxidase family protein [Actinomadura rubrisoli]TDD91136.1 pyridoxamine 5'-phosphate oxidase family protein [Actinomadura rubrisoli]
MTERSSKPQRSAPVSERVKVRRRPARGSYELDLIRSIFDDALLCHVAFVEDGNPVVLPTLHVRIGDELLIHGARKNRMMTRVAAGAPVCVEATVIDSLVLGRSVLQNSVNYRSAVVMGEGRAVQDPDEVRPRMHALIDKWAPGRLPFLRPLTDAELRSVLLVSVPITEASAKVRTGDANDADADRSRPVWAGQLPLRVVAGSPVPDDYVPADMPVPDHLAGWGEGRSGA